MNALERNDANDKLSEGIKSGWFVNERKWGGGGGGGEVVRGGGGG